MVDESEEGEGSETLVVDGTSSNEELIELNDANNRKD